MTNNKLGTVIKEARIKLEISQRELSRRAYVDIAEISRLLFDSSALSKLKAESIGISELKLFANNKAAIITMPEEKVAQACLTYEDFDDVVNIARKVAGVEIGAYIRASDAGEYKASLRSNSYADVAAICARHNGGGHLRAAGCTIKAESIYAAADIIRRLIPCQHVLRHRHAGGNILHERRG